MSKLLLLLSHLQHSKLAQQLRLMDHGLVGEAQASVREAFLQRDGCQLPKAKKCHLGLTGAQVQSSVMTCAHLQRWHELSPPSQCSRSSLRGSNKCRQCPPNPFQPPQPPQKRIPSRFRTES
jgi:hypothetical protein